MEWIGGILVEECFCVRYVARCCVVRLYSWGGRRGWVGSLDLILYVIENRLYVIERDVYFFVGRILMGSG